MDSMMVTGQIMSKKSISMIDELIDALERLQEAKSRYEIASKDCYYDRGYFLFCLVNLLVISLG